MRESYGSALDHSTLFGGGGFPNDDEGLLIQNDEEEGKTRRIELSMIAGFM